MISSLQRHLPDNTRQSQQTDIQATGGIRTHGLRRRAAADLRLRPRGHWDRPKVASDREITYILLITGNTTWVPELKISDGPSVRPGMRLSSHILTFRYVRGPLASFSAFLPQCWPGNAVGIATGYGLDGPGIESRWGRDFPYLSRPALGPKQPPVQWVPGLSRGYRAAGG